MSNSPSESAGIRLNQRLTGAQLARGGAPGRTAGRHMPAAGVRDTPPMSGNLDLVRSIYADWERGDFSRNDWAEPEVEYVWVDGPTPGSWSGLTGMAEGARSIFNAWEDYRVEAHEYRELDNERVLVFTRMTGRGKASGLALEQMRTEGATVFHVRDGKVSRHVYYWDRNRALADLGLEE